MWDAIGWAVDDLAVDARLEDFDRPGAGAAAVEHGVAHRVGKPAGPHVGLRTRVGVVCKFDSSDVDAVGQPCPRFVVWGIFESDLDGGLTGEVAESRGQSR